MQALDTNVLLRFLMQDDPGQCARVVALFNAAAADGRRFVIHNLVVLELVWVLENIYGHERNAILDALEKLEALPAIVFADSAGMRRFRQLARGTRLGLEDLLIGLESERVAAAPTLTFDRDAAKSPLFARF
jgi:predicted nucleic-acid-binding protein